MIFSAFSIYIHQVPREVLKIKGIPEVFNISRGIWQSNGRYYCMNSTNSTKFALKNGTLFVAVLRDCTITQTHLSLCSGLELVRIANREDPDQTASSKVV